MELEEEDDEDDDDDEDEESLEPLSTTGGEPVVLLKETAALLFEVKVTVLLRGVCSLLGKAGGRGSRRSVTAVGGALS